MAGFGIKTPRNRQPQHPVRVNTSNPDALGLQSFITVAGGAVVDLVRGVSHSANTATNKFGKELISSDYSGTANTQFTNHPNYGLTGPCTLIVFFDYDAHTEYGGLVACQDSSTTNGFEMRAGESSNTSEILFHRSSAASFYQYKAGSSNLLTNGSVDNCAAVIHSNGYVRPSTAPTFILNGTTYTGVAIGGTASVDTELATASTSALWMGRRSDGATQLDGAINAVLFFNRALTAQQVERIRRNRWALLQDLQKSVLVQSAAGGDSVTGNPITWQWEQNSSSVSESLNSSPTDWAWFVQTGVLVESVQASPTAWEWTVTTGDIVEGSQDILTTTPVNWEWAQGSASFVDKLDGNPVSWEWAVTTGTQIESLEANPVGWEWTTSTGELLGTTAIDTNPVSWEWEVTTGLLVQIIPEVGGTIGGKKDKHLKLPFYDKGKKYDSRIDLDEVYQPAKSKPDDPVVDRDLVSVDVRSDKRVDGDIDVRQDIKSDEPGGRLVSELLQEIKGQPQPVSVIEFPAIAGEPEGFDENDSSEEAAVIMLLLAA